MANPFVGYEMVRRWFWWEVWQYFCGRKFARHRRFWTRRAAWRAVQALRDA